MPGSHVLCKGNLSVNDEAKRVHTSNTYTKKERYTDAVQVFFTPNQWNLCFFNLLLHLLFALPRFTCINRSAIEVQEYFYTSCTGACTCNCICIFMVQMCIPCVCICAISANHAWGSCLYWRRQLKSMVHDNKLSFDFFYCLLTYKHLLINSYMKEVEFLFWY